MQMPLEIEENKNDDVAMNGLSNDGSKMNKLSEGSLKLSINRRSQREELKTILKASRSKGREDVQGIRQPAKR